MLVTTRMLRAVLAVTLLLAVGSTVAADRAVVSACWQKTAEGSADYRAERAAISLCEAEGNHNCRVQNVFCFDSRHCFATAEACREYVGRGSRDYRALRDALDRCQAQHDNCRVEAGVRRADSGRGTHDRWRD